AGLATLPAAQAAPAVPGAAGTIQTMGGITRNYQQGGYGPEGVNAKESQFQNPRGLAFAPNGDLYVTDALNNRVRKIDANGIVTLVAGNGTVCTTDVPAPCYTGDGGAAINATLNEPHGVAVDSEGIVYIADSKNCVIRKVDTGGIISTYAGTGQRNPANPKACAKTDGTPNGPVRDVALDQPKSLFMTRVSGDDTLYIADFGNSQIRMIDVDSSTPQNIRVAGTSRSRNYGVGAGQDALDSEFRHPESVWVAADGTMYVSDGGNNLIRKIATPTPGGIRKVSVIAGDANAAQANASLPNDLDGNSDGDGGQAINAHLDKPRGITGDNAGNLYVAEEHGSRIRRINLNSGQINTVAGDGSILEQRSNGGSLAIKGDPEGNALEAQFAMLHDIQIAPDGSLWIADSRNNRVRAMADVANAPGAVIPTGGVAPPPPPGGCTSNCTPIAGKSGYWMLGEDGKVFAFGDATVMGDALGRIPAGAKAVHIEPTPSFGGYWINDDRGAVHAFGNAASLGGLPGGSLQAGERVTSLSATPSGAGYWLFTSKGRVFTFGDAGKFGDLAAITLNGPIQSSIPTPSGKGYFMVGSDGGVFAFGDAVFRGSMGATKLNQPVMALVPTRTSQGYWLVASDGGIFAFGDARFRGSMGATKLNKPVVGMVRYGAGYLMVGADGGIFSFSDKPFVGSLGANPPARPITFAATLDT
ncbi:MAG TPA: hypothetical protein VG795_11985, partial [Acidimicrobiia bacterium]|nr:hypothetical protein [Acidimicrobiia bacterium]